MQFNAGRTCISDRYSFPPLRPGDWGLALGLQHWDKPHAAIHPCRRLCTCGARGLRPDRDDARHSPPPQPCPASWIRLVRTTSEPGGLMSSKTAPCVVLRLGSVRVSVPSHRKRRNRTPTVQTALPGLAARRLRFATNTHGQARLGSCWRLPLRPPSTGAGRTRVIRSQTLQADKSAARSRLSGQVRTGYGGRPLSRPSYRYTT